RRPLRHGHPARARTASRGAGVPAVPLRAHHGARLRRRADPGPSPRQPAEEHAMTYLLLSAGFVLIALVLAALLSRGRRVASLRARLIAATALVVLTAVFDNIMIAAGLFAYSPEHTSGISIGLA